MTAAVAPEKAGTPTRGGALNRFHRALHVCCGDLSNRYVGIVLGVLLMWGSWFSMTTT